MSKKWSIKEIEKKLREINKLGFISVSVDQHRSDDGVIGQILERLFQVAENNLSVGDLGEFELKAIRKKSPTLTLCHKKPISGLTPIQLFDRFGYERASKRDPSVMKKKLFTTIHGKKPNSLGLQLVPDRGHKFKLIFDGKMLSTWDLKAQVSKIDSIILVEALTTGKTNSSEEKFHFHKAYILKGIKDISSLIRDGIIVLDLCIDQVVGSSKRPHDRGPHIRIPKSKLLQGFKSVTEIKIT